MEKVLYMAETADITIGFKERKGIVFGNIAKENGVWKGVSLFHSSESLIILGAKEIEPLKMYDCKVAILFQPQNNQYHAILLEHKEAKVNVSIKTEPRPDGNKAIIVKVGDKNLYYDRFYGNTPNTNTFEGLIRGINMLPNNIDKKRIIDRVTTIKEVEQIK